MKNALFVGLILFLVLLASCRLTRNVPQDSYLLDKVILKTEKPISTSSELISYVRQHSNNSVPLAGKFRLKIYNLAGRDTSKWVNRFIQNLGSPPVIYTPRLTAISQAQLQKRLNNQGYLNAKIDTLVRIRGQKVSLTYNIKEGEPYRIRHYNYSLADTVMSRIIATPTNLPLLVANDLFDMDKVEQERIRIANLLKNKGYYNFSKEAVYLKADTSLNAHKVDLFLSIYPLHDSLPYTQYKLNNITIISGYDATRNSLTKEGDTLNYKDVVLVKREGDFLRNESIYRNNYLRKGSLYSDNALSDSYEAYNVMKAIKHIDISVKPSPSDSTHLLDATIRLLPNAGHSFKASLDGTNSAGDIGIAPSITYQHQNLFNGSEQLNVKLKGAYEFITGNKSSSLFKNTYFEYGVESSLSFPQFLFPWMKKSWREQPSALTQVSLGFYNQHRPEYTRQFFNTAINYAWTTNRGTIRHGFDLLDINYVHMPWVSSQFETDYLNNPENPLLKASYENQLIARSTYSATFINSPPSNSFASTYTLRTAIDLAGLLPHAISAIEGVVPNANGNREILGVVYAEYIKASVDYARTIHFSNTGSLAYHLALGLAYPYGNSKVLPFERRFFAGGANSVRGWSTRSLGPGSYKGVNKKSDFLNQTGDIKLDLSIESRTKLNQYLEFAAFIDAGNIWTWREDMKNQAGGQFRYSEFYKEIALAYGIGIRFDLDFLLLRLDTGMKAYDPALDQSERFVLLQPRLSRMAWHFAIGYPF